MHGCVSVPHRSAGDCHLGHQNRTPIASLAADRIAAARRALADCDALPEQTDSHARQRTRGLPSGQVDPPVFEPALVHHEKHQPDLVDQQGVHKVLGALRVLAGVAIQDQT